MLEGIAEGRVFSTVKFDWYTESAESTIVSLAESSGETLKKLHIYIYKEPTPSPGLPVFTALSLHCHNLEELLVCHSTALKADSIRLLAAGCLKIKELFLIDCSEIDDEVGIAIAEGFPLLEVLWLDDTGVGNEGLRAIVRGHKQLIRLFIANTPVTILPPSLTDLPLTELNLPSEGLVCPPQADVKAAGGGGAYFKTPEALTALKSLLLAQWNKHKDILLYRREWRQNPKNHQVEKKLRYKAEEDVC